MSSLTFLLTFHKLQFSLSWFGDRQHFPDSVLSGTVARLNESFHATAGDYVNIHVATCGRGGRKQTNRRLRARKYVLSIATKIVPAGPVRGILQGGHQVFSTILMYTEKRGRGTILVAIESNLPGRAAGSSTLTVSIKSPDQSFGQGKVAHFFF